MLETNFSSPSKAGVNVPTEPLFSVNLFRTYRANSRPLRHLGVSDVIPTNLLLMAFCSVDCHLSHRFYDIHEITSQILRDHRYYSYGYLYRVHLFRDRFYAVVFYKA